MRGEADLRDQIRRSARSVVANFCEGSESRSDAEFARYVGIARASNTEFQAWYEILGATGMVSTDRLEEMVDRIDHVGRSLSRLLDRLEGSTRRCS